MRVFIVSLEEVGAEPVACKTIEDVTSILDAAQPGDAMRVRVKEMTEEEFDELPEFDGF